MADTVVVDVNAFTAAGLPLPLVSERSSDTRFLARFKSKIKRRHRKNGCWIWSAGKDEKGYGRTSYGGRSLAAHRVAFALAHGRWPASSLMVCHGCNNPSCVNPKHLREDTQSENEKDKHRGFDRLGTGRWRNGRPSERILRGGSALSEWDVREIRQRSNQDDVEQIAMDFDVSPEVVRNAAEKKTFQWVVGEGA